MLNPTFSCYLIGSESLLIQCAESLLSSGHEVRGILSNAPQISEWASARSIPIIDPKKDYAILMRDEPFDYLLSVTNFSIIPDHVLSLPRHGTVNFHDGPLPDYAGLNVTTWAIADRAPSHGISWHLVDAGIDTGNVLVEKSIILSSDETAFSLNTKCFEAAIETFPALVKLLESRTLSGRKQISGQGKYFGKYHRPISAGVIDFRRPAEEIVSLIRSLDFGTYDNTVGTAKILSGHRLVVVRSVATGETSEAPPGTILACDSRSLRVATATNDVVLSDLLTESPSGTFSDVAPQTLFFPADRLPFVSEETLGAIELADRSAARNDSRAVTVLSDPHPAIPLSGTPAAGDDGFDRQELSPGSSDPRERRGSASCCCGDPRHVSRKILQSGRR